LAAGFSLTELLCAIALIGILGSLFLPAVARASGKAVASIQRSVAFHNTRLLSALEEGTSATDPRR